MINAMLAITEEERNILLQLLEQEVRDLHHGIHHCVVAAAKRELQERLACVERLREELGAVEAAPETGLQPT